MAELKTKPTRASVKAFLATVEPEARRTDSLELLALFEQVTGKPACMWGDTMVGFGSYRYHNTQGEAEWLLTGFSPRKQNLTVYIMNGFTRYGELLAKLGKHKLGKSCLYINKLADIDQDVLRALITASIRDMADSYSCK